MVQEIKRLSTPDDPAGEDKIADVYFGNHGNEQQQRKARDRINWMFDQRRGGTALDVGCSQGVLTLLLARSNVRVTGIDVNDRAIAMTKSLIEEEPAEVKERVSFKVADATKAGFIDGQFETVFIGEVVEHLERPANLVHAAVECLTPNGALVLTTPHGFFPHEDHRQAFGLQEVIDLLPRNMSVISIDVLDGYIRLYAEVAEGEPAYPRPEALLAISSRALIEQQKVFYSMIATHQKAKARLAKENGDLKTALLQKQKAEEAALSKLKEEQVKLLECRNQLDEAAKKTAASIALLEAEVESEREQSLVMQRHLQDANEERDREIARSEENEIRRRGAERDRKIAVAHIYDKLDKTRRNSAAKQTKLNARRAYIEALQRSATYQSGLALRHAYAKPLPNLFMLPVRLIKLVRNKQLNLSDPFKPKVPVIPDARPKVMREVILKKAERLRKNGDFVGEYLYLKDEADRAPTEATLQALLSASIRTENLRFAYHTICRIQSLIGPSPTPGQAKRLQRITRTPVMNLGALDAIPERRARIYEPVERRVAYILHNSLPHSSGGYATRAQGMATGMQQMGLDIVCVTRPGYPVDLVPELTEENLEPCDTIEGVKYLRVLRRDNSGGRSGIKYILEAARILEEVFKEQKPSCVIAASAYTTAIPALIAARRVGVPFVYEVRGLWEITRISREPEFERTDFFKVSRMLESQAAIEADHVLTLTTPMKEELIERGVPSSRISLVPNSCDVSRFTPRSRDQELAARLGIPPGVVVIGYIGSFVQYEGLEHLAEACAKLRAGGAEFRLLLVGNENVSSLDRGPITEEIMRIAAEEGLEDWLIMPGRVPHEEVEAYYSLVDIAPFPRKPQPVTEMVSPLKPLEALAMEKAVVVSSVRALVEMVQDNETGLVFEKGNVDSLAETLLRLISDPDLRLRLGTAGRKWVETERTWNKTATTVHETVKALIGADWKVDQSVSTEIPAQNDDQAIFQHVQARFAARDAQLGQNLFSKDDWKRVEIAMQISKGARRYGDIGIGQGQLVNCLAVRPDTEVVFGFDYRKHSKLIEPPHDGPFEFVRWNLAEKSDFKAAPVDIMFAMEVFEHVEPKYLPNAIESARGMARDGTMFVTVPYKEKPPLFNHDKPGGHQQSFDEAKIEELFGPDAIWSHYREKWFLVFASDTLKAQGSLPLAEFIQTATDTFSQNLNRK